MNLPFQNIGHEKAVSIFTAVWILLSLSACIYFSFVAFPAVLRSVPEDVELHFFTKDPGGEYGNGLFYLHNKEPYRSKYLSKAIEKEFLFLSRCDLIPQHLRPACDSGRNWSRIPIVDIGCEKLDSCLLDSLVVTPEDAEDFLVGLKSIDGSPLLGVADPPFSFENPSSWGPLAPYLMFLLTVFISFRSGRVVGEFLFEPYREK